MTVYETGRDLLRLGIIPLEDMLSETAFAKISWILANYDYKDAMTMIKKNLAREINERSTIG
jgi:glutamyl-tRNA(Gln) amidotransferase subunit D